MSCRYCTQWTDVPALVMRFCVHLLLKRGATTPSSQNTVKTKKTNERTNEYDMERFTQIYQVLLREFQEQC